MRSVCPTCWETALQTVLRLCVYNSTESVTCQETSQKLKTSILYSTLHRVWKLVLSSDELHKSVFIFTGVFKHSAQYDVFFRSIELKSRLNTSLITCPIWVLIVIQTNIKVSLMPLQVPAGKPWRKVIPIPLMYQTGETFKLGSVKLQDQLSGIWSVFMNAQRGECQCQCFLV